MAQKKKTPMSGRTINVQYRPTEEVWMKACAEDMAKRLRNLIDIYDEVIDGCINWSKRTNEERLYDEQFQKEMKYVMKHAVLLAVDNLERLFEMKQISDDLVKQECRKIVTAVLDDIEKFN